MFFTAELPGKSPLSQIYAAGHGCPVPHTRHRIPRTIPSYNWMSTSFHHCQPSPPFLSLPITSQWVLTSSGHEWRSEPPPDWMLATRCGHRKSPGHSGPFLCPQDHGRAGAGQILTETRPACRVHGSLLLLHTQAHRHTHTHTHTPQDVCSVPVWIDDFQMDRRMRPWWRSVQRVVGMCVEGGCLRFENHHRQLIRKQ